MRVSLEDRKIRAFLTLGRPKLLRLAVATWKNGLVFPHVSAVWYLWREGYFWVSTSEDRLKIKIIRKNSRVALIVDTDYTPYKGVIVEGVATLTKERLEEITLEVVKRYVPPRFVKKQYKDLMRYPRILIRIKPKKALDIMSYRLCQSECSG